MVNSLKKALLSFSVLCTLCVASAAQNEFINSNDYSMEPQTEDSSTKEQEPEVVSPATLPPSPPQKPTIANNPLETIFKFRGSDWFKRTAKDYGLENYKKMAVAPNWEKNTPKPWSHMGESYTQYTAFILENFGNDLINGPNEFTRPNFVCPKYNSLSRAQKVEFWIHMMAAITKNESGFDPKDRYKESTFGKPDKLTGEPVYSEGLLQLSYQDMKTYPNECGTAFDWEKDKHLSRESDQKTIFDPMRNFYCGIRILNRISKNRQSIFFDSNHYWAVLKPNGRYGKVQTISHDVRTKNPACK